MIGNYKLLTAAEVEKMSAIEIKYHELEKLVDRLWEELQKIEAIASSALMKAQLSHSLIVVRKVSEDNLSELKDLLD